jgi:O-antigen ligase
MGIIVIFALLTASSSYWDRVGTISTEYSESVEGSSKGTGGQRIYAWKLGWKIFIDNPVIGVGQGNYPWHVGKTEDEMGVQWEERSLAGRAAHSLYFTLLPELGLVGTFIFLLIIIFSIKDLVYIRKAIMYRKEIYSEEESKKIYYLAMALEGSLVGFLTSSVFISTLYYPNLWLLLAFIISLRRIVYNSCGDLNLARPRSTIRDSIKYA